MRSVLFLLKRYIWPRETTILSLALWISVLGVALGIVQLMVVLSVMSGFENLLEEKYTRITSQMVILPRGSEKASVTAKEIAEIPAVKSYSRFFFAQGMILKNGVGGVTLEGIVPSEGVTHWKDIWLDKPMEYRGNNWIWIGKQLADKLQIQVGDKVDVLLPKGSDRQVKPFVVTAITKFGIYDHDLRYARVDLNYLKELSGEPWATDMYKTHIKDGMPLVEAARETKKVLGARASVRLWNELNQNVFLAVKHQKKLLFLVLEIVVALAAMNVVNLLMISSHSRRRDIAILRAMGFKIKGVFGFFVLQGTAVGLVGIVCGVWLGVLTCKLLERFQPAILSEAVYNVTRLPVRIMVSDVLAICVIAGIVCVVFSIVPALKASRMRPVEALRYE